MEKDKKQDSESRQVLLKPQILLAVIAVLLAAVIILGFTLFQQQPQPPESEAVARVNGEPITKDQLFDALYAQHGREILDQLITRVLIVQEAKKLDLEVSDEELDEEINKIIDESFQGSEENFLMLLGMYGLTLETFREDARLNLLVRKLALSQIDPTEEDARQFFEDNFHLYEQPEEIEARHILLETEAEAQEIYDLLAEGADFVALAAEFSQDFSNRADGGYLGFFKRGAMIEDFEEVAFALEIGEISEPVSTAFGFHIIELLDRREEVKVSYEDVSEEVMEAMIEEKIAAVINELVQSIYEDAEIEYLLEDEPLAEEEIIDEGDPVGEQEEEEEPNAQKEEDKQGEPEKKN